MIYYCLEAQSTTHNFMYLFLKVIEDDKQKEKELEEWIQNRHLQNRHIQNRHIQNRHIQNRHIQNRHVKK